MRRRFLLLMVFLLPVFLGNACVRKPARPPALTPVTFQLQWTHTAANCGYYAAALKGFYAEEGISLVFLEGGFKKDSLAPVLDGAAQFAEGPPENLIQLRSQGKTAKAVAVIYRRSPVVFMSKSALGITHPRQFKGKTIRIAPGAIPTLRSLMAKMGIRPGEYREVNLPSDPKAFATGEVPVWGGYLNVMAVAFQNAGEKLNIIYPDDYGVHGYARALVATDDLIRRDPGLVKRFLRATLKGWDYAVEHPEEAAAMVKAFDPRADDRLENQIMLLTLPLVNTGEDRIGWMKPEAWAGMEKTLREQGALENPVDVREVYTNSFIEEIPRP